VVDFLQTAEQFTNFKMSKPATFTDYFLRNATGYNGGITMEAYPPVTEPFFGKSVGERVKVRECFRSTDVLHNGILTIRQ